jgi:hypothetical protein
MAIQDLTPFDHAVLARLHQKEQEQYSYVDQSTYGIEASELRPEHWNNSGWARLEGSDDTPTIRRSLNRLIAHGLVELRDHQYNSSSRKRYSFISKERIAAVAAEAALTPAQRAERFIGPFKEAYIDNTRRYGDRVTLWPIRCERWGDGLEPAIELGLVVKTGRGYDARDRYVPTEFYEAYTEALAAEEAAKAKAKDHREELARRLSEYSEGVHQIGPGALELTYAQVAKLLEHLDS